MNDVMRLLKDRKVSAKLRGATRQHEAAQIIVEAGKAKGLKLTIAGVTGFLKTAPRKAPGRRPNCNDLSRVTEFLQTVSSRTDADALTRVDLTALATIKTTLETKLISCSKICCFTCRTSVIIW